MRRAQLVLAFAASFIVGAWAVSDAATGDLVGTDNSGGGAIVIPRLNNSPCWRIGPNTVRPSNVAFSACSSSGTPNLSGNLIGSNNSGGGAFTIPRLTGTPCWRLGDSTLRMDGTSFSTCVPVPPSTTSTTTTTTLPGQTTTTTQPPQQGGDFVELFTGDTGFERFVHGVYHRDSVAIRQQQWSGDHDLACGNPDTQRVVHRNVPDEAFWLCADHLMTSMGDTSGYSLVWFKPNQTFSRADTRSVSWDVSVTDLLSRKWWEVAILPVGDPDEVCSPAFSPDPCGLPTWSSGAVVAGMDLLWIGGNGLDTFGIGNYCFGSWKADPAGCASKVIRRHFVLTDNGNGTITYSMPDIGEQWTVPGQFPAQFKVVFKDHNYTPLKDGTPVGLTWHWDSVVIQ